MGRGRVKKSEKNNRRGEKVKRWAPSPSSPFLPSWGCPSRDSRDRVWHEVGVRLSVIWRGAEFCPIIARWCFRATYVFKMASRTPKRSSATEAKNQNSARKKRKTTVLSPQQKPITHYFTPRTTESEIGGETKLSGDTNCSQSRGSGSASEVPSASASTSSSSLQSQRQKSSQSTAGSKSTDVNCNFGDCGGTEFSQMSEENR